MRTRARGRKPVSESSVVVRTLRHLLRSVRRDHVLAHNDPLHAPRHRASIPAAPVLAKPVGRLIHPQPSIPRERELQRSGEFANVLTQWEFSGGPRNLPAAAEAALKSSHRTGNLTGRPSSAFRTGRRCTARLRACGLGDRRASSQPWGAIYQPRQLGAAPAGAAKSAPGGALCRRRLRASRQSPSARSYKGYAQRDLVINAASLP